MDPVAQKNKEIALEVWGRNLGKKIDVESEEYAEHFRKYHTEDYWNHASEPGKDRGLENAKMVQSAFQLLFTDAKFEIDKVIAEGDLVMLEGMFSGYNTGGTLYGIPASGRYVQQPHVHILRFRDFKISEHFVVRDDFVMWKQMTDDETQAGLLRFAEQSRESASA
jgi:predicted ester cyclase